MRVLYLNPFSQEVSGPDESLRTLLTELIPNGVEAHVVLPAPGPQVVRYEGVGARVHFAPLAVLRRDLSLSAAGYPLRLARSVSVLRSIARQIRADLIHTNMEVLLEGGVAARWLGVPHVLHYRGNTNDRPRWIFDALIRLWTNTADHVYCISEATAGLFRSRGLDARIEVLYNPVNGRSFVPGAASSEVRAELGAGPGDLLVGTVGRIHPRKDIETFVRAAAAVRSRLSTVRFVVVGEAEAEVERAYLERVRALVSDLNLGDRFVFAGARRDIPEVMRALDLFVLTSRHEGFGRVVAEAMTARRPIVVTDEGALPELVGGGRYGLTAPPATPRAFAAQMLRLLEDKDYAEQLAAAAAAAAIQFDSTHIAVRVAERYRQLLERRLQAK